MDRRSHRLWLAIVLLVVLTTTGWIAAGARPNLGLDLQGGISAIYTPTVAEGEELDDGVLDETIDVIRARVDSLGVAEPEISRQGDDVLVQLPGLDDAERAQEVIGTTAQLTFRRVEGVIPPGTPQYTEFPPCIEGGSNGESLVQEAPEGDEVPDEGADGPDTEGDDTGGDDTGGDDTGGEDTGGEDTEGDVGAPDDAVMVAAQDAEPTEVEEPAGEATTAEGDAEPTGDGTTAEEGELDAPTQEELEELLQAQQPPDLEGLELYRLGDDFPNDERGVVCGPVEDATADDDGEPLPLKYALGEAELAGSNVTDALPQFDGTWVTSVEFDGEGADAFEAVTAELACERDQGLGGQFAIVLDNVVESAPSPTAEIACGVGIGGGSAVITVGQGEEEEVQEEAQNLALVLRTGALPITLEPSTFETVSPTLGSDSLRSGVIAGVLGLLLVAGYLVWRYRWLGGIAIGALLVFGAFMLGIITLLGEVGFTLTLAGIAGIIVSIGITADSSVLYFERIQDEASQGRTVRTSVKRAFESAWRTNLAGNAVTFIAAGILYFLAVGPVRGFALTLGVATVLDLLLLYGFTRPSVGLMADSGRRLHRDSLRLKPTTEAPQPSGAAAATSTIPRRTKGPS